MGATTNIGFLGEIYKRRKSIMLGMNGVAVARHGPILKDNEATGSGKIFKYLQGLPDTIHNLKKNAEVNKNPQTPYFTVFIFNLREFI